MQASGYTTAAGNELTTALGYTYTYDRAGNMLTATQTSTGDVWTYTYDFRGRLTSAVEKSASGTVLESESYVYDPFDNRIGTVSNGVTTWTLYDASSPIMDFSSGADRFVSFAGLLRDNATGLNLAIGRAENPGLGRWTQQDLARPRPGDPPGWSLASPKLRRSSHVK